MVQHFGHLQTPLRSIHKYPLLADQERRFSRSGWHSVTARSLWDLWSDPTFLSPEQRIGLNDVEPFDEWEEFALFASHYFLLVAVKVPEDQTDSSLSYTSRGIAQSHQRSTILAEQSSVTPLNLYSHVLPTGQGQRRFGSAYQISPGTFGHYGGLGTQRRLESSDVYRLENSTYEEELLLPRSIEARMCHTMTHLKGTDSLLVGGRTSPDRALRDCWLRRNGSWKRAEDLPLPLYRHCATSVELCDGDHGVLIYGGKSSTGKVSEVWMLWRGHDQWERLEVRGDNVKPRFGAVLAATGVQQGILLGGMTDDGTVCDEFLQWNISHDESRLYIEVEEREHYKRSLGGVSNTIHRLGACLTWSSAGLLLVGGVSRYLLPQKHDIVRLIPNPTSPGDIDLNNLEPSILECEVIGTRPLLVGHSIYNCEDSIALAGGGAVCFSFGTYWNQCIYTLGMSDLNAKAIWSHYQSQQRSADSQTPKEGKDTLKDSIMLRTDTAMSVTPRMSLQDPREFKRIVEISNPIVMEGMVLGPCVMEWSLEALKFKVGAHRQVVVHEATDQHMSFQKKNFSYVRKSFGDFIDQITAGSKLYLRSLSSEKPSQQPAQLALDFPELASDFSLPSQLELVARNAHSSPLRISGPVIMWLHYDV